MSGFEARAEVASKIDGPAQQLRQLRNDLDAELAQRTTSLEARRRQASDLAHEVQQAAGTEAEVAASVEEAQLRVAAAEARARWQATAPAHSTAAPATPLDEETTRAVNKVSRL